MNKHHKAELLYHITLTSKYRKYFWITDQIIAQAAASAKMNLVEFHNHNDHLHLLAEIPPSLSISKSIEIFKCQTSRLMKYFHCKEWQSWSRGYFIRSVGPESDIVQQYIEKHFK
jgi:putative transposase